MILAQGGGIVIGHPFKTGGLSLLEQVFQVLVQVPLVLLHCQEVVGFLVQDALGDLLLAPHGANGDDAVLQVQQFQKPGDGGDFVGFSAALTCPRVRVLAEAQALTRCRAPLPDLPS